MPLRPVCNTLTISWLNHDSWSETYVGTRKLIYEIFPNKSSELTGETAALCQLVIVGANHMMEVALFDLIRPSIGAQPPAFSVTQAQFNDAGYYKALSNWVTPITGTPLDLGTEPFISTERLRKRRNDTVHKTSAIATVEMAKTALYSVVEGTKVLYAHFGKPFKYQPFIENYPMPSELWFSTVRLP